jgi:enamine deaminase RidA (YjgF/YER057c/UK114 family)
MPRRVINSSGYQVPIAGFTDMTAAPANGDFLFVSGITSRGAGGEMVAEGDYGGQMRQILENIKTVLAEAGATMDDVVQIRTFIVDITKWDEINAVWAEYWGPSYPASTLVQISRLYDERQLIEMEAVASIPRAAN